MTNIALNAFERTEKKKKFHEAGFVPGIMYGDGIDSTMIKLEEKPLRKIIAEHGSHARIDIKYGKKKRSGFIKEIQTLPINNSITHVDVQVVSDTHEIKMQVPIIFRGSDNLQRNQLILQPSKHEIEVSGIMSDIPEDIIFDVSELQYGDKVLLENFEFTEGVTVLDDPETIYASIIHMSKMEEVETEAKVVEGAPLEEGAAPEEEAAAPATEE